MAGQSGRVDSSNYGIATEDAVISSGLPDQNLDVREFNDQFVQQLMNTSSPEYSSPAAGAMAQEYMIFKFDFSSLPLGAVASDEGSFDFSAWYTQGEEPESMDDEQVFGRFRFFEITAGDSNWTDAHSSDGSPNPNPVTWNSLNGVFVELSVTEDNTDPPDNTTGQPFGVLYSGKLVSNGGFDGANRLVGISKETINRLISGESVGLAMGSFPPEVLPTAGDYDSDADVDGRDLLSWQRQLGDTVPPGVGADGNGNGVIDEPDLQIWREHLGMSSQAAAGTTNFSIHTTESFLGPLSAPTLNFDWEVSMNPPASVPEPRAQALICALTALYRRSRRT